MNNSLSHRGPDANGFNIIDNNKALGHRRLSIIDLDQRSNQPMVSNNKNSLVVYNGEIINFRSLKKKLCDEYDFRTKSDTEVILAAYETRGIEWLLKNANGMFAFAIYDRNSGSTILARDRFGIKPLYYTIVDNTLIFSSEVKGILNSGLISPSFNEQAIDDYLGHRQVREPYTFFKKIYKVKSSSYLKYSNGNITFEKKYWQLPSLNFDKIYNENDIVEETKSEVENAINRWFISDVRVGAYLSGGVDSSLTTAILCKAEPNRKIDTYTIGFKEKGFNEFKHARKIANKYSTNHREILLNQDNYFDEWSRLITYKDEPLAVPNEIPLAMMSKQLSKDITVVISGEGADELFGGYGRIYRSAFDYKNHFSNETTFYEYFMSKYEYTPRNIRDKYLDSDKSLRINFDKKIKNEFHNHSNEENIFRFFQQTHIKGLLNRLDMTTMQTSVEARPPFLDHELIEFVYKHVPYDLKLKWVTNKSVNEAKKLLSNDYSEKLDIPKYILKKASESYLPNEIIHRKKMGFPVPLTKWFPDLQELALEVLSDVNWLKPETVQSLCLELENSNNNRAGQLLWMFINIEKFKNLYFNKEWRW